MMMRLEMLTMQADIRTNGDDNQTEEKDRRADGDDIHTER